jgi:hypothetical protein
MLARLLAMPWDRTQPTHSGDLMAETTTDLHEIELHHPGGRGFMASLKVDGVMQKVEFVDITVHSSNYPRVTLVYNLPQIDGTFKRMKLVYEGELDDA